MTTKKGNDMDKKVTQLLPAELIALARFCQAALTIINARLFTLLGLLLTAVAFAWVLVDPDWIRFSAACAFALLGFWPVQRMEQTRINQQQGEAS